MKTKNLILYATLALVVIAVGWVFFWLQNRSTPTPVPESEESTPVSSVPDNVANAVARGDEFYNTAQYDEAFEAYNLAIQNDVELAGAYAGRGNIYMLRRHFADAALDYTEALKYLKTPEVLASRCNAYRMTAKYELAMEDCQAAIELDPESADAYLSLGMLQLEEGNLEEARTTINDLLELYPDTAEAYLVLSQIAITDDNLEEAIEMLSKGIEISPTEPQLYWERGFLRYVAGQVAEAKEDMQKVLEYGKPETDGELLLKAGSLLSSLEGVP